MCQPRCSKLVRRQSRKARCAASAAAAACSIDVSGYDSTVSSVAGLTLAMTTVGTSFGAARQWMGIDGAAGGGAAVETSSMPAPPPGAAESAMSCGR
jgi:hypothetical protein